MNFFIVYAFSCVIVINAAADAPSSTKKCPCTEMCFDGSNSNSSQNSDTFDYRITSCSSGYYCETKRSKTCTGYFTSVTTCRNVCEYVKKNYPNQTCQLALADDCDGNPIVVPIAGQNPCANYRCDCSEKCKLDVDCSSCKTFGQFCQVKPKCVNGCRNVTCNQSNTYCYAYYDSQDNFRVKGTCRKPCEGVRCPTNYTCYSYSSNSSKATCQQETCLANDKASGKNATSIADLLQGPLHEGDELEDGLQGTS